MHINRQVIAIPHHTLLHQPTDNHNNSIFQDNYVWLLNTFSQIHRRDLKKPDWRKLFDQNIKARLDISDHQSLLFYFKVAKIYSQQKDQSLDRMIESLKYAHSQPNNCKQLENSNIALQDYFIIYNKNFSERKLKLLTNVITRICTYFSSLNIEHSQLFLYYSTTFKNNKIKEGLSVCLEAYIRLVRKNEIKFPLLNIYKIMMAFFELYQEEFGIEYEKSQIIQNKSAFKENISIYTLNLVEQLNLKPIYQGIHTPVKAPYSYAKTLSIKSHFKTISKEPLQIKENHAKYFNKVCHQFISLFYKTTLFEEINKNLSIYENCMMQIFTSRLLAILSVIDKEDNSHICKELIYCILRYGYHELFSQIIELEGNKIVQMSYLGVFKYVVSFDYHLTRYHEIKKKSFSNILQEMISTSIQIIQSGKVNDFQTILQLIFKNGWNKYVQRISQNAHKTTFNLLNLTRSKQSQFNTLTQWQPFIDFMLKLLKLLNKAPYKSNQKTYTKLKADCLITNYFTTSSKKKQHGKLLLDYLKTHIIDSSQNYLQDQMFKMLSIFAINSTIDEFNEICFLCSSVILRKDGQNRQRNLSQFYVVLNNVQIHLHNISSSNEMKQSHTFIYIAKITGMILHRLFLSFKAITKENEEIWFKTITCTIQIFMFLYDYFQAQTIEMICKSISHMLNDSNLYKRTLSIITSQIYIKTKYTLFEQTQKQLQLQHSLLIYESIYSYYYGSEDIQWKLDVVDFCFNLKLDLYSILNRIDRDKDKDKDQNPKHQVQVIYSLINKIESIEVGILQQTPTQLINSLYQDIHKLSSISTLTNLALKIVYYILYKKEINNQTYSSQPAVELPNDKKKDIMFDEDLEYISTQIHQIKQKIIPFYTIFTNFIAKMKTLLTIGRIQIYELHLQNNLIFLSQLNDLMYIIHLCDMPQFQTLLLSLRLSVVYQHLKPQIFVLQLSKYYFILQWHQNRQNQPILQYIQHHLTLINRDSAQHGLITLMINGEVTFHNRELQNYTIYKCIYLAKNNGIYIFNLLPEACRLISRFVFHQAPKVNADNEKIVLKGTREVDVKKRSYWVKESLQQGWFCTKLLIIMIKGSLKMVTKLNQLSRLSSILKFIILFSIRTAHLIQLNIPFQLYIQQYPSPNVIAIVDHLAKIHQPILHNNQAFHFLQKILLNKRKSICLGLQSQYDDNSQKINKIFDKINTAFIDCGKIGLILGQIFCYVISKQLNVNEYIHFRQKSKMKIFSNRLTLDEINLLELLTPHKETIGDQLSYIQQLTTKICSQVVDNYSKAIIIKESMSQFINHAFDQDHIQQFQPHQHRRIDRVIASLAIAFQEMQYLTKQFLYQMPNISFQNMTIHQVRDELRKVNHHYREHQLAFHRHVERALPFMIEQALYPCTIIFPLAKYIFILSFKQELLVTFCSRFDFQDNFQMFSRLILNNEELMKNRHLVEGKKVHKTRVGIDRQFGKITSNINFGIADVNPLELYSQIVRRQCIDLDLSMLKFYLNKRDIQDYYKGNKKSLTIHFNFIQSHYHLYCLRYKISLPYHQMLEQLSIHEHTLKSNRNRYDENLLIYVHYQYIQFPYELIKSISTNKAVYRLPSLHYLMENQQKQGKDYDVSHCKYLVNTKNDLMETQARFQKIRSKFESWIGIKGRLPTAKEINSLFSRDIYLYMGHGSGFELINKEEIGYLQPRCLLMIFGCASARVIFDKSEPSGDIYRFLMRGCPAYLGCLWTVTDIDIDLLTEQIFTLSEQTNLSLILQQSRKKCPFTFPYINGSATIIYGLPIYLKR